jgi:hypothetical protein
MNIEMILYIGFIMYVLIMFLGFLFKIKWLFMIAGLLWFIPIFEIDNIFLIVVSSVMIVLHGILGFYEPQESEF